MRVFIFHLQASLRRCC